MKKLSRGFHNEVWAVDEESVAKVFELGDPQAQRELAVLERALVSELMPRPVRIQPSDGWEFDLLVMERLRPMEIRGFDEDERAERLAAFETRLRQLHAAGIAHGDIRRNVNQGGGAWDNVFWAQDKIMLIDAGSAVLSDEPLFEATRRQDLLDLEELKLWAVQQ